MRVCMGAAKDNTALAVSLSQPPALTTSSIPISALRSSEVAFVQQQLPSMNTQPAADTVLQWPHPDQELCNSGPPNFSWGDCSGQTVLDTINSIYEEVIHWKPNLFLVPFGSAGTTFVKEITRLFQAFADGSSLECVSMKAITLIQILLLQKPSKRSKTKEHISVT